MMIHGDIAFIQRTFYVDIIKCALQFLQTDWRMNWTLINPLRPNSDLSQTSPCNIKGLSVSEVMRIENIITQVKFY